jgi:crotonobetainyl-CoA:carnitine CoA-transferase CaiB-like acyl-CoA transferase
MRTTWTPHAPTASSLAGEAIVSGRAGQDSVKIGPVTIDQFPAAMLNAAMLPSAIRRRSAYIVAWRRRFAPI